MVTAVGKVSPRDDRWSHDQKSEWDSIVKEGSGNMPGSRNSMCKGPVPGRKAPGSTDGVWREKTVRLEALKVTLKLWFPHLTHISITWSWGLIKTPIPGPHPEFLIRASGIQPKNVHF